MLFNSAQFLFGFLPVAFLVFFLLGLYSSRKLALGWLAIASLAFYRWDDPFRLLPIILSSITFNFIIGRILVRGPNRGALAIGLFGNLLLLGYFKYAGFLAEIVTTGSVAECAPCPSASMLTRSKCPDALACGSRGCGQSKEVFHEFCRSDQFMLPIEQFVRSISTGIFS
jgi:hypothetical protein